MATGQAERGRADDEELDVNDENRTPAALRLTREELLAAAALAGLKPSPEIVGLRSDERDELERALLVGRRVLLARGLVAPPGKEGGIDPRLLRVVQRVCEAPSAFFVGRSGAGGGSGAFLYADEGEAAFLAVLEPYLYSVVIAAWDSLDDTLANVAGLGDAGKPTGTVDVSLDLSGIDASTEVAPDALAPALRAALDHLATASAEVPVEAGASSYSILALPRQGDPAPHGTPALAWVRLDAGGFLVFDLQDIADVRITSATAAQVRSSVRALAE